MELTPKPESIETRRVFRKRLLCTVASLSVGLLLSALVMIPDAAAQEIDEVVPEGEARLLVIASRGLSAKSGAPHRMVIVRMLASNGTRLSIVLPENHDVTYPFQDDSFVDWTIRLRNRFQIILKEQGYEVGRRSIYRRSTSEDILAIDSIEIKPPAGVSILSMDFEIVGDENSLEDVISYDVYTEYQAFVTPDPDVVTSIDWELFTPHSK